jgi:hypothetical protein
LVERGHQEKARAMLEKIRGTPDVQEEFDDLVEASEASRRVKHPFRTMLERKYRPQMVMAIAINFFQQRPFCSRHSASATTRRCFLPSWRGSWVG